MNQLSIAIALSLHMLASKQAKVRQLGMSRVNLALVAM